MGSFLMAFRYGMWDLVPMGIYPSLFALGAQSLPLDHPEVWQWMILIVMVFTTDARRDTKVSTYAK